jgi:hypothetical protein
MGPQRVAVAQLVLLLAASAGRTQAESVADAIERAMQRQQQPQQQPQQPSQRGKRARPVAVSVQQVAGWLQQEGRLERALAAVRSVLGRAAAPIFSTMYIYDCTRATHLRPRERALYSVFLFSCTAPSSCRRLSRRLGASFRSRAAR